MMDGISEAIDKIAEKLGVAAGQIVPYFDQYAQMQASVDFILLVACAVALAVCVVVSIIGVILYLRCDDYEFVIGIPMVVGAFLTFALVLIYMDYYKWTNFPDAMLLDTVISNIAH